jgi:flagellar basal body rod protein FlgG
VLAKTGKPIQVDPNQTGIRIDNEGQLVSGDTATGTTTTHGKLLLVQFDNVAGLQKEGNVLLRALPQAGPARAYEAGLGPRLHRAFQHHCGPEPEQAGHLES